MLISTLLRRWAACDAPSSTRTLALSAALAGCAVAAMACGSNSGSGFSGVGGGGGGGGDAGGGGGPSEEASLPPSGDDAGSLISGDASLMLDASGGVTTSTLTVTVRDFKFWNRTDTTTNPDFQNVMADDHAAVTSGPNVVGTIVSETLGSDNKPVYKNTTGTTITTHGAADFNQWYNDVAGTNITQQIPLVITMTAGGTYGYDSLVSGVPLSARQPTKMWFPIDDGTQYATTFGNQGQAHNYSFTTELHTVFTYYGGETFAFSGDDDVFVFINSKLVIDLGGVHTREAASVLLDQLGLTVGQMYHLDLFNAERHTTQSNLSFTTTLNLQPVAQ